jgi:heptosyltransferase-2
MRTRQIRSGGYDLAVLLPDSPRAALAPWLAGVRSRVGFFRDPVRWALLTQRLRPERSGGVRIAVPTIERYLTLTRALGCPDRGRRPELVVDVEARARVARDLAERDVPASTPVAIVTPGASFGSSKLWPPEHFAQACDGISSQLGLLPVLVPGPGEFDTARRITAKTKRPCVAVVHREARLADLKAWVERSRLVLTNDTGPRHVAVALDRPVVVLMGPTNPTHTALHLERQRVLRHEVACSPCQLKTCPIDQRCMTGLMPDRVLAAAEELLSQG